MNARCAIVSTVIALAVTREVRAEETDHDRAVAAFTEARKRIDAGDCPAAIRKLEESLAYEQSIGAHYSFAECTRPSAPYVAYWHLREAALLAYLKHDDRITNAEDAAAAIAAKTGGLRIDVDAVDVRAQGFELTIDDQPIDRFHLTGAIALPPGTHRVVAKVADGRRHQGDVGVSEGTVTLTRVVLLGPPPAAPPPPPHALPAPNEPRLSSRRTLALGLAAGGVAALAVGAAFGVVALEKRSELDRACNGDRNACTGSPRVVDPVLDSAEANATVSTILLAVGGALLAGGAVLWFTEPPSASKNVAVLRW